MSEKVVFLGMGGTIAGTAASATDNVGYTSARLGVSQLLHAIPALQQHIGSRELLSEQVAQVDSRNMEFAHWVGLAGRVAHHLALPEVRGLVITHGTDTLEETAYFLSQVISPTLLAEKPVVLTCAMRPATSLAPDGPQNVLDAAAVVCTAGARGVLVVCAGSIHAAHDVQKVHTYRPDAFDSGEAGPVGVVEEGAVRLLRDGWPEPTHPVQADLEALARMPWPRVEIVTSYAGALGATVRALCAVSDIAPAVRGLVVAGTGNGTIHQDLEAALLEVQAQGVRIVRASRCARGRVISPTHSTGAFPDSAGLSPVKARIALMLDLISQPAQQTHAR